MIIKKDPRVGVGNTNDCAQTKCEIVVVVECYCFLIIIMVGVTEPRHLRLVSTVCLLLLKLVATLR